MKYLIFNNFIIGQNNKLLKDDGVAFSIQYKATGGGEDPLTVTQLNIADTPFWIRGSLADARFNLGKGNDDFVQFVKTNDPHRNSYWAFTSDGKTDTRET